MTQDFSIDSPEASWLSTCILAINLPRLKAYEDTLQVVGTISQRLAWCYVLTFEGEVLSVDQQKAWPKLELIHHNPTTFPKDVSATVSRLNRGGGISIIHDFFGHFASFCESPLAQMNQQLITVHTQRTTNWGWFSRVRPLQFDIDLRYAGQRTKSLWFDTRILHAVDHVTVMGLGHEKDLVKGHQVNLDNITFIASETDCERFKPNPLVLKENILLYTGALVRAKGLDLLFDLFTHLFEDDPSLKLVLIGRETSYEKTWFRDKIASYPLKEHVELVSFLPREELIHYYQKAKLYLFPSHFEGSPRSLREAIACGTPAVASDIPGNRGIDPQGQFIHFAPVSDLKTWLKKVRLALKEPLQDYENRSQAGVAWLNDEHHLPKVALKWMKLYVKLAKQKGLINC